MQVAVYLLLDAMRRTASFIAAGACLFLSSACERARGPHLPRYEVIYYDRNHDGIADLEFHHAPGWADADWGFVDSDYNAEYDILFGPGYFPSTKVHVPVPGPRSDHEGVAKRVTRFQVMPPIISRSQPQLPQGDYRLEGSKVTFTTKGPSGEVDYKGMISKEGILFHIHSRVTDASHNHLFVFRLVEFPTTAEPLTEGFR